ncbi:MAG: ATP-binding cassette domain-containing protein [Peptococcaceae bacterium]|nr:ATP-binding cassette domain-containing protein [Peptococcaceae bacterium]
MTATESAITIENLTKSFGSVRAVNDVTFAVNRGEILGLLGHNGAGKSTIIRCILGIKKPDKGMITVRLGTKGKNSNSRIGYLPEERGLYKDARVMDILVYLAGLKNCPADKARLRAREYLEKFDLAAHEKAKVSALSKGMAQKVQFIAALVHEPELLILDEPISGLDPVSQDVIIREVRGLAGKGTTILLSSHQMNFVESICNRIVMLHEGRSIFYGSIAQLKEIHGSYSCEITGAFPDTDFGQWPFVEKTTFDGVKHILTLRPQATAAEFLSQLPSLTDVPVDEFSVNRLSLHDIFVKLVTLGGTEDD